MTPTNTELEKLVERLRLKAVGLEVAADCEARIEAAYAPELARWDAGEKDEKLTAMVRNLLDARANARRFIQEAADLRGILTAIESLQADRVRKDGALREVRSLFGPGSYGKNLRAREIIEAALQPMGEEKA